MCSPCCAIYALQWHVLDQYPPLWRELFLCWQSPSELHLCIRSQAVGQQQLLLSGTFKLHQWACYIPDILTDIPAEVRWGSCELWLSLDGGEPTKWALGLLWHWTNRHFLLKTVKCNPKMFFCLSICLFFHLCWKFLFLTWHDWLRILSCWQYSTWCLSGIGALGQMDKEGLAKLKVLWKISYYIN